VELSQYFLTILYEYEIEHRAKCIDLTQITAVTFLNCIHLPLSAYYIESDLPDKQNEELKTSSKQSLLHRAFWNSTSLDNVKMEAFHN
jgi:hypothetical protein